MLADDFFLGTKLYHKKLLGLCKSLNRYLGVTHAIYVNINKQGQLFSICTHPKWVERFLEEKYYQLDPLMVHPKHVHNGFSFDSASEDQDFKDTLLYDAVIKFNWCHSFAYMEKTAEGGYFAFDFGTSKENFKIISRLINEAQIVKKTIRELHHKLNVIISEDLQHNIMDFAGLKGESFHTQKGLVYNEESDMKNKIQLLNETGFLEGDLECLDKVSLSPQEINCLRIYLETHSIKKVSRDLDLAVTTVSSYIENIKNKLNCRDKNQLFEVAEILASLGHI